MDLLKQARDAGEKVNLNKLIDAIPYAKFIGIEVDQKGSEITTILRFDKKIIGNPMLPALHGGVIGSFLETTAIIQLAHDGGGEFLPKPIDLTIDFLRSGKPQDTYARARITKRGRRVANVHVEAWQDEHTKAIAAAHGHFLMKPPEENTSGK